MLPRVFTLLVIILLAICWPAQAQSPPLTLLQPGSGVGLSLDGSKVSFSVAWSVPVCTRPPLALDGMSAGGELAVGASLPVSWALERLGLHLSGILAEAVAPLSSGAYLWSEAGSKPLGGCYLRASVVRVGF